MQNDDINHFTLFLLFLKLPKEFWFLKIRDFIPIKTQENWSSASFKVVDLEVQKFEDPQTGDNWGKETNPWEDVTELPLMVATFYPIFFFFFPNVACSLQFSKSSASLEHFLHCPIRFTG